jgi:CheY-like chemotaxis protein
MGALEKQECLGVLSLATEQIFLSIRLLDDVGDLGKFDQGMSMQTQPEVTSLATFGQKVMEKIPSTAPGVKVVLELTPHTNDANANVFLGNPGPALVMVDPNILKRVLDHLLANAADLTQQGTIALRIGYNSDSRLTFVVSDTGPGLEMAPDAAAGDLPTVFQKYHQEVIPEQAVDLEAAATLRDKIEQRISCHKRQGMGVGLSLSYHLVQEIGGELRCSSTMGQGTTFWFSLPRKVSMNTTISSTQKLMTSSVEIQRLESREDCLMPHFEVLSMPTDISVLTDCITVSEDDESMPERNDGDRNDIRGRVFENPEDELPDVSMSTLASVGIKAQVPPNVLVVEDTKLCAMMLCMILTKFNISSQVAVNGQLAVDILQKATPGTFDLILMDLRMPVMDGLEATDIIKNKLKLDIPVIALTADDTEDTRKTCEKIGFDGFQGKPLKRNVLKEVIKEFTGYEVK